MNRDLRGLDGNRSRLGAPGGAAVPQPTALLRQRARGWELGLPGYIEPLQQEPPAVIAVGGGKGGVGKSLVSANLAARLAATGRKVVCFDLDVGGSNLHTYFGLKQPSATLADVCVLGRKTLAEAAVPSGIDGVRVIAGGGDEYWGGVAAFDQPTMRRVAHAVLTARTQLGADIVVLDLGAGTQRHTIDFFALAHLGIATVLPEPTSIENAYLFLRTSLVRTIANVGQRLGASEQALDLKAQLLDPDQAGRPGGYADRLRLLSAQYPGLVAQITTALQSRLVGIAVNQARAQKDIDVGRSMEVIGERYFGLSTRYLGWLPADDAAWKSLRNTRLLVCDFPHSGLAKRLDGIAKTALQHLGFG